jgi:hypothetical protein
VVGLVVGPCAQAAEADKATKEMPSAIFFISLSFWMCVASRRNADTDGKSGDGEDCSECRPQLWVIATGCDLTITLFGNLFWAFVKVEVI